MQVKITATAENLKTGAKIVTNVARFTFVALDKDGGKAQVPPLLPQTEEEKRDFEAAEKGYRSRKQG
jgi:acyl-CoA hydrolase